MPISAPDLAELAKVSLDEYLRNIPVDQISTDRPLLKRLMAKRKLFMGAKQNIVANVRKTYGSNFTWAYGESVVGFNKRNTTELAQYPWYRAVDGLYLDHDRLFGAGINVREGDRGQYKLEQNEKVQLLNLMDEQMTSLKEGFLESLDLALHRNGQTNPDAVNGLDHLISYSNTGVVGTIDRATNPYWRNNFQTTINTSTRGTLLRAMETNWRRCVRNGGSPDMILAGSEFLDAYRNEIVITQNADVSKPTSIDGGVGTAGNTGMFFKGVPIEWDPQFETLQMLESATINWNKRCYFLNTKHIHYRDNDMDIVTPVRPHNVLATYAMVNLRLALTMDRANCHAALSIA